jgi:excinuclease ABC subunit C
MKIKQIYSYADGIEALKNASKNFPDGSGVYKFLDSDGQILYVGKAKNLKKRITSYLNNKHQTNRIKLLINLTKSIRFIKTLTDIDSFILENNLIKQNKPRFNIRLIDDKSYPFISISKSAEWPRIRKFRGRINKDEISFGPYSSVSAVDNVIKQIEGAFLIRSCSDNIFKSRKRPCILYQIKRCSAPCVGLISKGKYTNLVRNAISFLDGKDPRAKEKLINEMKNESDSQNYEKAARLRDRIRALSKISNEKYSDLNNRENFDIIFLKEKHNLISIHIFFFRAGKNLGNKDFLFENTLFDETEKILSQFLYFFYSTNLPPREILLNYKPVDVEILKSLICKKSDNKISIKIPIKGKKKALLKMVEQNVDASLQKRIYDLTEMKSILSSIKKKFNLRNTPSRIEIYDNSHLSGTSPIGGMVVFENGDFQKNSYRKFNIICPENKTNDDYFMMNQVIRRRFNISSKWKSNLPKLMIIDGGKGQLNIVNKIINEKGLKNIDLIGIAKGKNRNSGNEKLITNEKVIQLEKNDKILFFLQRLRDEAHRYVIQSTRAKHQSSFRNSVFDKITGIGKKTKLILLSYFGSIDNIKTAGIDDLKKVPNIGLKTAERIYKEFNKNV